MDKHLKLQRSIQGMKTQQGYLRQQLQSLRFAVRGTMLCLGLYFATIIICYCLR
jgi:hypothetical protein